MMKLDDLHIRTICVPLMITSFLKTLDLSFNRITDASADVLAEFISKDDGLDSFSIANNDLTAGGMTKFVKALCANRTLQELDISRNELGEKGGDLICEYHFHSLPTEIHRT